jgi:predicted nucleic acid-binding protein
MFLIDTNIFLEILSLPNFEFYRLIEASKNYSLDFDDAYQYSVSELFNLEIVTMDKDFQRIGNNRIHFL